MKAAVESQMQMNPVSSFAACAAIADAFDGPTSVVDESVTATAAVRAALRQRDPDSYFFFKGGGLGWGDPRVGRRTAGAARPQRCCDRRRRRDELRATVALDARASRPAGDGGRTEQRWLLHLEVAAARDEPEGRQVRQVAGHGYH